MGRERGLPRRPDRTRHPPASGRTAAAARRSIDATLTFPGFSGDMQGGGMFRSTGTGTRGRWRCCAAGHARWAEFRWAGGAVSPPHPGHPVRCFPHRPHSTGTVPPAPRDRRSRPGDGGFHADDGGEPRGPRRARLRRSAATGHRPRRPRRPWRSRRPGRPLRRGDTAPRSVPIRAGRLPYGRGMPGCGPGGYGVPGRGPGGGRPAAGRTAAFVLLPPTRGTTD